VAKRKTSANASLPTPKVTSPSYDLSPPGNIATQRLGTPPIQQTSVTESLVNAAAIYLYRQARFTPISFLNPEVMSSQLSEWNVGTMRRFSLTMDAIEARDCLVKSVTSKLKMSLSRRSYEIVKVTGADEGDAESHAQALEYFYSNVEVTNAVDRNIRGGFGTLVYQMMDATLKRYAVHEIVWKPIGTEQLTASFVFVPLWFFENRTGSLRFAGNFAWDGIPLKEGNWMVTVGDGIMEAICVAWMYKTIALRDWLIYSERNGMPMPIGKTAFGATTPGYKAMKTALDSIGSDTSILIGIQDAIDKLEFGATGQLPYPILVEYMDKIISAVARGADLSTLSSGKQSEGVGATLQGEESELIEQHNGQMVTETLNHYVDPYVLRWHFGPDTVPCAYIKLNIPKKKDTALDIQVDEFLLKCGVRLGTDEAMAVLKRRMTRKR
jgi:phage gp29-like protein